MFLVFLFKDVCVCDGVCECVSICVFLLGRGLKLARALEGPVTIEIGRCLRALQKLQSLGGAR